MVAGSGQIISDAGGGASNPGDVQYYVGTDGKVRVFGTYVGQQPTVPTDLVIPEGIGAGQPFSAQAGASIASVGPVSGSGLSGFFGSFGQGVGGDLSGIGSALRSQDSLIDPRA
ncbi:MAG: hypothetical protein ACREU7_10530, partial [Burkholderiales bacterium]